MGEPAWKFAPRDGEPMVHVFERMKSCVDRIAGEHPGKNGLHRHPWLRDPEFPVLRGRKAD